MKRMLSYMRWIKIRQFRKSSMICWQNHKVSTEYWGFVINQIFQNYARAPRGRNAREMIQTWKRLHDLLARRTQEKRLLEEEMERCFPGSEAIRLQYQNASWELFLWSENHRERRVLFLTFPTEPDSRPGGYFLALRCCNSRDLLDSLQFVYRGILCRLEKTILKKRKLKKSFTNRIK